MRHAILVSLIVVVLCACAAAMEQPAQVSPGDILIVAGGDPNEAVPPAGEDPNRTWDPVAHLVADWESIAVSMTSRLYNPAARPDEEPQGPQWSLSLVSTIDIIDSNGLIAWSHDATSVTAYDQDGRLVSSTTNRPPVRMYQPPRYTSRPTGPNGEWESVLIFNQVSLRLPMEPDAVYPQVLRRVEWMMNVLVAEESTTVDIPFEPNETWVELTPGMEIMVEQATVEEGKYQYRVKVRCDSTRVAYLNSGFVTLWRDEMPPATAVLKMDVLNAEGQAIRDLGGGGFSSSSSAGTTSGSGNCDACGTAATFRYTLVFNMYEQEARFVLEDIPVPTF